MATIRPPLLESCATLVRPNGVIVGSEIASQTRRQYPTLLSCIPFSSTPFIVSTDHRTTLNHCDTAGFIENFGHTLHSLGVGRHQRVALVLPNGPELALAILAVSQWTGCVPLSATGAVSEVKADLLRCGPDLIIGPYSMGPTELYGEAWMVHRSIQVLAEQLDISYAGLLPDPDTAGPFKLWLPLGRKTKAVLQYSELPHIPKHNDHCDGLDDDESEDFNTVDRFFNGCSYTESMPVFSDEIFETPVDTEPNHEMVKYRIVVYM